MYTQHHGAVQQKKPVTGVTNSILLYTAYTGSWGTSVEKYWDDMAFDCDGTYKISINSSGAWTVNEDPDIIWTLNPTSGAAGTQDITVSCTPDLVPDNVIFSFKIGSTTYASARMWLTSTPCP